MKCNLFVGESLRTHSLDFRIVRFIVSTNSKIQRVANTEHVTRKQLLLQCVSSVHKIGTRRLLGWLVEVVKTRQLFTNVPWVMDIIPWFEKDRFGLWFQVGKTVHRVWFGCDSKAWKRSTRVHITFINIPRIIWIFSNFEQWWNFDRNRSFEAIVWIHKFFHLMNVLIPWVIHVHKWFWQVRFHCGLKLWFWVQSGLVDLPQYLWFDRRVWLTCKQRFMKTNDFRILRDTSSNRFWKTVWTCSNNRFWNVWELGCRHLQKTQLKQRFPVSQH